MSNESTGQDSPVETPATDPVENVLAPFQSEPPTIAYDCDSFDLDNAAAVHLESPSQSASPFAKQTTAVPRNFAEAITSILQHDKAMRRLSWAGDDAGDLAYLRDDGYLTIFRNGREFQFLLHESDIMGEDWVVVPFKRTLTVVAPPA